MSKLLKNKKNKKGFTLIEILVVVGLIAILATITIVAINPAKNFRDTRNTQRRADIGEILDATSQFLSEEGNTISDVETLGGATIPDCDAVAPAANSVAIGADTGNLDLDAVLVDEFLAAIPEDPSAGDADDTGYTICQSGTSGRIEVAAPNAEPANAVLPVRR